VRNSSKFCKVAPTQSRTHERKKDGGDRWIVSQVYRQQRGEELLDKYCINGKYCSG
jgi:hypothetical protein